ncbi:MAG TPA: sigma-70 family RNA polymerase sigma factor [Thermoanaerobaculia bacterium]|jgi:RNA polymerase sigma-70 factor (ECF subfamily)
MNALTLAEAETPLERARSGDHDAFAELVERHEGMVFSIALHFFDDRARAEEIAQDVFLQLYRSMGEIETDAHLLFWLRQVTSRRCIDGVRRARMRLVSFEDIGEVPAKTHAADPLLDRKLQKLIAGLPDHQRIIVTLRYQEDLDPSEICGIVGMPVNTVKSHLHRALVALRKKLGDH